MKSTTITLFPIFGALKTVYEFKNQARGPWVPQNEQQTEFMETLYEKGCEELVNFSPEEMKYISSFSHQEINKWLTDNGFDINLSPFQTPTDFGSASIMDILVKWVVVGKKTEICVNEKGVKKEYKGVILNSGYNQNSIQFKCDRNIHPNPIASVTTKNGDIVHMTIADKKYEGLKLLTKIHSLMKVNTFVKYEDLHFPMIDIEDKPDISWLKGMFFKGISAIDNYPGEMTVNQAFQQTRFKMNDKGARVKSAAAVGMMRCTEALAPLPMVIDKPFFLWITRKNVTIPYFVAYFDFDSWKDPGSLKMSGDK